MHGLAAIGTFPTASFSNPTDWQPNTVSCASPVWPWWPSWGWEARLPWWGCIGRFCHLASHLVPLGTGERQIRILALGRRSTDINPLACWLARRCRICRNGRAARCARAASPPIASVAPEASRLRLDTSVLGFTQVGGLAFLVDTG